MHSTQNAAMETLGRSPHGERGLKFRHGEALVRDLVALLTESVD